MQTPLTHKDFSREEFRFFTQIYLLFVVLSNLLLNAGTVSSTAAASELRGPPGKLAFGRIVAQPPRTHPTKSSDSLPLVVYITALVVHQVLWGPCGGFMGSTFSSPLWSTWSFPESQDLGVKQAKGRQAVGRNQKFSAVTHVLSSSYSVSGASDISPLW